MEINHPQKSCKQEWDANPKERSLTGHPTTANTIPKMKERLV
jgi:hypothetical protein